MLIFLRRERGFEMSYNDMFQIDATLVANEFLDKYMPSANGDYVKVYLYLLRNHVNGVDVETAAEQLELTEGDVRRAINYWRKCGILSVASDKVSDRAAVNNDNSRCTDGKENNAVQTSSRSGADTGRAAGKTCAEKPGVETAEAAGQENGAGSTGADDSGEIRNRYRRTDGREALERLSSDDEFRQLLFIVQKYRSKILTESEEQVLAYLYDGLHLPCEVLDYLVQYCVENNHNSMRYIEKTGLDWAGAGIRTVRAAQQRTKAFEDRKKECVRKERTAKNKAGITRGKDLDSWLNQVVQSNI